MNLLSSFSRCRVLQNNFSYLKCSTVGPCRFMSTKPVITDEQSKSFNKKLAMLQKKYLEIILRLFVNIIFINNRYGVKGTTKFLSLEREMWHLRHKVNFTSTFLKIQLINKIINNIIRRLEQKNQKDRLEREKKQSC